MPQPCNYQKSSEVCHRPQASELYVYLCILLHLLYRSVEECMRLHVCKDIHALRAYMHVYIYIYMYMYT